MSETLQAARHSTAWLRIALLAILAVSAIAVACGDDDEPATVPTTAPTATAVPAPTEATEPTETPASTGDAMMAHGSASGGDLVIPLGELNGSGQTGIVTLTDMGDQTGVEISIASGASGIAQPVHIHAGSCDDLGGVDFPLTNIVDGGSSSVVDTPLSAITAGGHAINAHMSAEEIATYVACGDLPAHDSSVTIAMSELNNSGQPGAATLIASGDQTTVVVSVGPSEAEQPIHIHDGSCDNLGGVEYPLTNAANGISVTTVDASLQSLLDGDFAINLHESADNVANYTACGDITSKTEGDAMMMDGSMSNIVIALDALNESGQSGTATLSDKGDQTEVVVNIASGAAGVPQPIHVHSGTCDSLGGVDYPLENVVDGQSTTLIDTPMAAILDGDHAINAHKSADEVSTYVACGSLPAAGASATIHLGELNSSGQSGWATLIADGDSTTVVVSITPGAAGVEQPIHIHDGSCDSLGGVAHPLTNVADGVSMTSVTASLQDLLDGEFAINAHESGDNVANYVACGDITAKADGDAMMMEGSDKEGDAMEAMPEGPVFESDIAQFTLEDITVPLGTTIVWTNTDNAAHTVSHGTSPSVDANPEFRSDQLRQGDTYSHTFNTVGEFSYFCEVHPSMTARITVTAS